MNYFLKIELSTRWALCLAIVSLFGCSQKTEINPRRFPSNNPSSNSVKKSTFDYQSKKNEVKRNNDEFDTYQNYQSIDAPLTLKELKKNRRRPVLNVQELNSLMDKNFKKPSSVENVNTSKIVEKASCTEEKCELKKVINYNKAIAKKGKLESAKTTKDDEIKKTDGDSSTDNKNGKENKDKQKTQNQQVISNSIKNTSGNKPSSSVSKSIKNSDNYQELPPISLPKIEVSPITDKKTKETLNNTSSLNPSEKTRLENKKSTSGAKTSSGKENPAILQNIKNTEPVFSKDFLGDQEIEAKPMPPVKNKIKLTSEIKSQTSGAKNATQQSVSQSSSSQISSPISNGGNSEQSTLPTQEVKTSGLNLPAPQFNKEESKSEKVTLINKILINYYYKLKNKISRLFDKE